MQVLATLGLRNFTQVRQTRRLRHAMDNTPDMYICIAPMSDSTWYLPCIQYASPCLQRGLRVPCLLCSRFGLHVLHGKFEKFNAKQDLRGHPVVKRRMSPSPC